MPLCFLPESLSLSKKLQTSVLNLWKNVTLLFNCTKSDYLDHDSIQIIPLPCYHIFIWNFCSNTFDLVMRYALVRELLEQ